MLLLLCFGAGVVAGGVADVIDDAVRHQLWEQYVGGPPAPWIVVFKSMEEIFEPAAVVFLLISVSLLYSRTIGSLFRQHPAGIAGCIAGFVFIAFGNSLLHFGYHRTFSFLVLGHAASFTGTALVIFISHIIFKAPFRFFLGNQSSFYLLLIVGLVALPALHGQIPEPLTAAIWLPVLVAAGWYGLFAKQRTS